MRTAESNRSVVITRDFDAPPDVVWRAWTTPQTVARWWGPHSFTTPVCEMDLRVGGALRIVMRGPDGRDYPLRGEFLELDCPRRLVYANTFEEMSDDWLRLVDPNSESPLNPAPLACVVTVTLEDMSGRTRLTIETSFQSPEVRAAMVRMRMIDGWIESFERLDSVLMAGVVTMGTSHRGIDR